MNVFMIASALVLLATAPAAATVRLVKGTAPDGSTLLTMTNLDEEGRRLGGELTDEDRRRLWGYPDAAGNQRQLPEEFPEIAVAGIDNAMSRKHLAVRSHSSWCGCPLHRRIRHHDAGPLPRGTWQSAADPHARAIDVTPYTRGTARERNRAIFHRD